VGGDLSSGRRFAKWEETCRVGGDLSSGRRFVKWEEICQVGGDLSNGRRFVEINLNFTLNSMMAV